MEHNFLIYDWSARLQTLIKILPLSPAPPPPPSDPSPFVLTLNEKLPYALVFSLCVSSHFFYIPTLLGRGGWPPIYYTSVHSLLLGIPELVSSAGYLAPVRRQAAIFGPGSSSLGYLHLLLFHCRGCSRCVCRIAFLLYWLIVLAIFMSSEILFQSSTVLTEKEFVRTSSLDLGYTILIKPTAGRVSILQKLIVYKWQFNWYGNMIREGPAVQHQKAGGGLPYRPPGGISRHPQHRLQDRGQTPGEGHARLSILGISVPEPWEYLNYE